ncbi:3'-5' exonuclease domain-containing protein 2 [Pseudoalteromonas arctica]|uniref:3'-5' exonuclease domain-containing protein 2 n=1 Tax=Pseudoalteromonas arctica TaxID=394751 RepID=A0AAP7CLN5_9GAMM|nr:3'-5' exonuclease [Pseudoalteromonas arctica]NMP03723.1 3'-5' exonuclease domain-containing protein 2 [Pseudoalteromonas arctica]
MERLTKEQIQFLPMYDGLSLDNIIVVTQASEAISAIVELKKHVILGFDTESKPCFKKGEISDCPHLIQLSTKTKAFLFPTKFFENFTEIEDILSDPTIKKVGFGLKEDKKLIFRKFGIKLENTVELSSKVMHFAQVTQRVGARAAVAMFFNQRLSKGAQRSNWSVFPLKDHQKVYAANDAHSALLIELEIEKHNSSL